jgi:hypothetical protein
MRTSVLLLFTSIAFVGNAAPPTDTPAAEPLRLYVVTGGHDYHMSFYRLFENSDFRVNLHPHPGAFQGDLRGRVDVLVLYDMVQVKEIGDQGQKNLRDFLESGKGLVVLHHAIFDYGDWEWYWREVSGVRQNPNRDRSQPDYVHDVKLQIEPVATHPILSGIAPFQIIDETFHEMPGNCQAILSCAMANIVRLRRVRLIIVLDRLYFSSVFLIRRLFSVGVSSMTPSPLPSALPLLALW